MSNNAFSPLERLHLHIPGRLFPNSCCPDKDLILLSSRLGGADRISLWNLNHGSKIWETDVGSGTGNCTVCSIAWSPDGQSIAVIQDPPAISVHSLQDGRCISTLLIVLNTKEDRIAPLTGIWWFEDSRATQPVSSIPDVLPREGHITGSSLSVLKILPLLDSLRKEDEGFTATDVFAFQGSHTKANQKVKLPRAIEQWPTLAENPLMASINSPSTKIRKAENDGNLGAQDSAHMNSIMLVADRAGRLFSFLDGTFSLGYISFSHGLTFEEPTKMSNRCLFVGQPSTVRSESSRRSMKHMVVDLPLLSMRESRDFAKLATAGRALAHYCMRVVKEMREAWFGSDTTTGAREFSPKWIKTLEMKQKDQFGEAGTNPILDLTYLLTTGRASDALLDLLGSGEQTSERGLQKWETSVVDALTKLRDSSEKRLAPALQRLHLILEELQGWSRLPQFSVFRLEWTEIGKALDVAKRGILLAGWLAAAARKERSHFRQFISWLRFEVNTLNAPNETHIPRHDLLEVNQYFMSGLTGSDLDSWFEGPVPRFSTVDLGLKDYKSGLLSDACEEALKAAEDFQRGPAQKHISGFDLTNVNKNIDALVDELARKCQKIVLQGSGAGSRSAVVSFNSLPRPAASPEKVQPSELELPFSFRERTALGNDGEMLQHLLVPLPSEYKRRFLLMKIRVAIRSGALPVATDESFQLAVVECYLPDAEDETDFDILDAGFFDDETVVIIYRLSGGNEQTFIGTVKYDSDHIVGYQKLSYEEYVNGFDREDLMQAALDLWKTGHIPTTGAPVDRRHALLSCRTGGVTLALNGRIGRRVACVLDGTGTTLESFDLEGEAEEDMEDADDARAE